MMKKILMGLDGVTLQYEEPEGVFPEPETIVPPQNATLLMAPGGGVLEKRALAPGDSVRAGRRLILYTGDERCAVSPISGTVASISTVPDDLGRDWTQVSITGSSDPDPGAEIEDLAGEPSLEGARRCLSNVPGAPCLDCFSNDPGSRSVDVIVINGVSSDLMLLTAPFLLFSAIDAIRKGVEVLKKITGVGRVVLTIPSNFSGSLDATGAEVKKVPPVYPQGNPALIMKNVLGMEVPAGGSPPDMGAAFFSVEAVISLGKAFETGRPPQEKLLTLVDKRGAKRLVYARIGTPVGHVIQSCGVEIDENDLIIMGGPMTGSAVYSENFPVRPDTDGLMILKKDDVHHYSDYPCVNCGECVRVCPADVPVNMLVRFLEAGRYEEAAESWDLMSCVDCGLCAFVCVARMPVFQYIRLAKYEISKINAAA
jgi:Na+-translocating ferredoxin:NAD+ oxidoreductase subunit C